MNWRTVTAPPLPPCARRASRGWGSRRRPALVDQTREGSSVQRKKTRRPAVGRRRNLRADAAGEPRQGTTAVAPPGARTLTRGQAGAAAYPRLEEGRARTMEPRPGGSPSPRQNLGAAPQPPLRCFCRRRWRTCARARCRRR